MGKAEARVELESLRWRAWVLRMMGDGRIAKANAAAAELDRLAHGLEYRFGL